MKKLCCFLVFALAPLISWGQDVVATYNISQISSYLKVNRIGDATFSEIKQNIDSLREKYHSADFVIDFLNARGDYGLAAVALADSLSMLDFRMAFIVGKQTERAAEQVAMFLRNAGRCIIAGDVTKGGLVPDIHLTTNNEYQTAWYDSIQSSHIIEKTIREYTRKTDVKAKYHDARKLLDNFGENGELIDLINAMAEREGIRKNDNAFYYSGYMVVSLMRAELLREVYPEARDLYHQALNVPVQQAIQSAVGVMESSHYRELTRQRK